MVRMTMCSLHLTHSFRSHVFLHSHITPNTYDCGITRKVLTSTLSVSRSGTRNCFVLILSTLHTNCNAKTNKCETNYDQVCRVPMDEESIPISAFVTPFGQFQWKCMPFGLRNAPGTFPRLITSVTGAYLDDLIIFSDTWSLHMKHLAQVFSRLRPANLTVKKSRCVFAMVEVEYLGRFVGNGKVAPRSATVESILRFPQPKDRKQLRSYLGVAEYFRKFIPHFAHIASILTNLHRKGTKFIWTEEADN